MKTAIVLVLCGVCVPLVHAGGAWKSDFKDGLLGGWEPYGSACKSTIVKDAARGQNVLQAEFDDSSPTPSANKGARIKIGGGLAWEKFNYLSFCYKVNPAVSMVGCLLHDANGNWWQSSRGDPNDANAMGTVKANAWDSIAFKKASFVFKWNDDATIKAGEKNAEIVELFISVGTPLVNKGTQYTLRLDDIAFTPTLLPDKEYTLELPSLPAADEADFSPFPSQWKVSSFNSNGNLVVDGQPIFPLGLLSCFGIDQASATHKQSRYTGEVTKERTMTSLRAIKDAGFNLLQTYTMQFYGMKVSGPAWEQSKPGAILENTSPEKIREGMLLYMDYAQAAGLKVIIGARQPYCVMEALPKEPKAREETWTKVKTELKTSIEVLGKHPALIAWYLIDEPSQVPPNGLPVADLTAYYRYIKSLDPVRPMLLPSCSYLPLANGSDRKYRRSVDIMSPDHYPIVSPQRIQTIADTLDLMKNDQVGSPAMPQLWPYIQICQWVEGRRLPSTDEIRLMSLLAMTRDVKGLMFYQHSNYPENNPEQWKNISQAIHSLYTVIPDILAPSEIVKDYTVSNKKISSLLRKVTSAENSAESSFLGKLSSTLYSLWDAKARNRSVHYSLIAVNPAQNGALEPEAQGLVTFDLGNLPLPIGSTIIALDEDQSGQFSLGGRRALKLVEKEGRVGFSDEFGAFASHVYRIGVTE